MVAWQKKIGGCFGDQDQVFAGHPLDEQRAFELLTQLRDEDVRWEEFAAELRSYLSSMPLTHQDEQFEKVHRFYEPWLAD